MCGHWRTQLNVDTVREMRDTIRNLPAGRGREMSRDLEALAEAAAEKAKGAEPPKPEEREMPAVGW